MTPKQGYEAIADLEAQWALDSNSTENQERLFQLCEQYISAVRAIRSLVEDSNPEPPPPRVRPS